MLINSIELVELFLIDFSSVTDLETETESRPTSKMVVSNGEVGKLGALLKLDTTKISACRLICVEKKSNT